MELKQEQHGAVTILCPEGALTSEHAQEFSRTVAEAVPASSGRLAINCEHVPFTDSAGLEALLDAADLLGAAGQSLRLIAVTPTLREAMDLTGTASLFECYADVNAAVRSFL